MIFGEVDAILARLVGTLIFSSARRAPDQSGGSTSLASGFGCSDAAVCYYDCGALPGIIGRAYTRSCRAAGYEK